MRSETVAYCRRTHTTQKKTASAHSTEANWLNRGTKQYIGKMTWNMSLTTNRHRRQQRKSKLNNNNNKGKKVKIKSKQIHEIRCGGAKTNEKAKITNKKEEKMRCTGD